LEKVFFSDSFTAVRAAFRLGHALAPASRLRLALLPPDRSRPPWLRGWRQTTCAETRPAPP